MNWKCELVMDLAPLYYDGVASRVSKRLVKKHLRECPQCRTYYKKYHPVVLWGGFLSYLSTTIVALVFWYAREQKKMKKI